MRKTLIPIAVLLASCQSTGPTQAELAAADYGAPPYDVEKMIHANLRESLFDYDSAKIEIGDPYKGWWGNTGGLVVSRDIRFGWVVDAKVSAKNRMGGYTGWSPFRFYFQKGVLVDSADLTPRTRYR